MKQQYRFPLFFLQCISVFALTFLFFITPPIAYSAGVILSWDPNSEPDITGYRAFYREEGQAYNYAVPAWEGSEIKCYFENLNDNVNYYFVVRALNADGFESDDSDELRFSAVIETSNSAPTADAGPDRTVDEGSSILLNGLNSSDPDGNVVSYSWTQLSGPNAFLLDAAAAEASFTAPDVGQNGESLVFQLLVSDDGGLQATDTCIVNVSWVNMAPTADTGADLTVDEGSSIILNGLNSSDPDGNVVSYSWTQLSGPAVVISNAAAAEASFTAPDVGQNGESLVFQLLVSDNGGLQATDTCIVNVSWVNMAPAADAGTDRTVEEGSSILLNGLNSLDPDGMIVHYGWAQTFGTPVTLSDPNSAEPSFTAPIPKSSSETLIFELTVTDDGGLAAKDRVEITINSSFPVSSQTIFDLRVRSIRRSVLLKWNPVSNAESYNVYRGMSSGGPYDLIAGSHTTKKGYYRDYNVMANNIYYYVVTSTSNGIESLDSNEAAFTATYYRRK